VHLGDAADHIEVGARHLAGQDAAEGGILGRAVRHVVADQLVVGVAQLKLGHRGVVALDDAGAGLGQGGVGHQGRALGDLAAAVRRDGAGVVADPTHGHARGGQVIAARIVGQAVERGRIGRRVRRYRGVADRLGVLARRPGGGADATAQQGGGGGDAAEGAHWRATDGWDFHGRGPFRVVPALMSPVVVWLELTTTVLRLPWTATFRWWPMAVEPRMLVPPLEPTPPLKMLDDALLSLRE